MRREQRCAREAQEEPGGGPGSSRSQEHPVRRAAGGGSRHGAPVRQAGPRRPGPPGEEPQRVRRPADGAPAEPSGSPPAEAGAEPEPPVQVEVRALRPETREQAEPILRGVGGVEVGDPRRREARVVLYAVHAPRELVALLRPSFEPHPRSLVLDLEGAIDLKVAALRGLLGYLRRGCTPEQYRRGVAQVADGYTYAPESLGAPFYQAWESPRLTGEMRQMLDLIACGRTHEQICEALGVSTGALRRRLDEIRKRLCLERRANLALAAAGCGFGSA